MPLLEIENLTVEFATAHGAFRAVDSVSLSVEAEDVRQVESQVVRRLVRRIHGDAAADALGQLRQADLVRLDDLLHGWLAASQ